MARSHILIRKSRKIKVFGIVKSYIGDIYLSIISAADSVDPDDRILPCHGLCKFPLKADTPAFSAVKFNGLHIPEIHFYPEILY